MDRQAALTNLGNGLADRLVKDYQTDQIYELLALKRQYPHFTQGQKAQWITVRMATLLRVYLQRARSEADQYCFMDAMLGRYIDANILSTPEIVAIRKAEAKLAGMNHVALNRTVLVDILLGFYGLFVIPQPYELGELLSLLKDIATPVVFDQYFRRGLPREMEFGIVEMLEFHAQFMNYIHALTQTCEKLGLIAPLA
jgi:hypothetical protein